MIPNFGYLWLRRCWRVLEPVVPAPLGTILKSAVKPLVRRPTDLRPDDLRLQLDAILRELRRLHMRLEELQETRTGSGHCAPSPWPSSEPADTENAA